MPDRDAIWVLPNGQTTVVTLDEDGNLIIPASEPAPVAPAVVPEPTAPVAAPKATRRRRRR